MLSPRNHRLIGRWESPEPGRPQLEFTTDGVVAGNDGCNEIHSTYVVTGEGAVINMFVSTLKACLGVNTWLQGVQTVLVRGNTLIICDAMGSKIGELHRVIAE